MPRLALSEDLWLTHQGGEMRGILRIGACAIAFATPCMAHAADVALKPSPTAAAPVWSWTGLYAGIHLGNGWANNTWRGGSEFFGGTGFAPFLGAGSGNGAVGGGQIGLNYQIGSWVWGAEIAFGL